MKTATRVARLYDRVKLKAAIPAEGLSAGALGTIVLVFDAPKRAYEVEFLDDQGGTIALVTLEPEAVETLAGAP